MNYALYVITISNDQIEQKFIHFKQSIEIFHIQRTFKFNSISSLKNRKKRPNARKDKNLCDSIEFLWEFYNIFFFFSMEINFILFTETKANRLNAFLFIHRDRDRGKHCMASFRKRLDAILKWKIAIVL